MKKLLLNLLVFLFTINSYSQTQFTEGSYTRDDGTIIEALIKNMDWKDNPVSIQYKLADDQPEKEIGLAQLQSFSLGDFAKYEKYRVAVEQSSESERKLSKTKEPEYEPQTVMLNVVLEGQPSLYEYRKEGMRRYFYGGRDTVKPLLFKSYLIGNDTIAKNEEYKLQLWNNLRCNTADMERIQAMVYAKYSLLSYFKHYHQCKEQDYTKFDGKRKRDLFNLNIRPGARFSAMRVDNNLRPDRLVEFEAQTNVRVGIELEVLMPFHNNKWALQLEPTYHSYSSTGKSGRYDVEVEYSTIEMPLGVRHYFYLSSRSSLFLNAAFNMTIDLSGNIEYIDYEKYSLDSGYNYTFGAGFRYNKRYIVELRYSTPKDVMRNYSSFIADYNSVELVLGYSLF